MNWSLMMSDRSIPFSEMADRIAKIDPFEFGGAVVVLPPGENAVPIAFVTTDPHPDLMQFWSTVKARVEVRATEMVQQAAAQLDPWAQRR